MGCILEANELKPGFVPSHCYLPSTQKVTVLGGAVVLQKLACNQGQRCGRTEGKLCAERGVGKQVEVSAGREEGQCVCLKEFLQEVRHIQYTVRHLQGHAK